MSKVSILELANDIRKEKGLYKAEDDYSLRQIIRDKMDRTPYLLECHFIENFIDNYICKVANNKQKVCLHRLNNYRHNYNESTTILKDYYPKSIIKQFKIKKDSFYIGFTDDGIVNRCEISVKYNDGLKIYIEMNFKHLGIMTDCFIFTEKELIQVTKCKDTMLSIVDNIEEYHEKARKAVEYRVGLCKLAKDKDPNYSIFSRLIEICDALLTLIDREEELTLANK